MIESGKTPGVILNTGPGMQHMVRVTSISDEAITYLDPTKPGELQTMPWSDFRAAFQDRPEADSDYTGNMSTMAGTSGKGAIGGRRR
ncbi:hypothetical protein D3C72_2193600 [compost metagenome]